MKVNFHWLAFDWPKRQKNNINIFALAGLSHTARPSPFLAVYFLWFWKKIASLFSPCCYYYLSRDSTGCCHRSKQCVYGEAVGQQKVEVVKFFTSFTRHVLRDWGACREKKKFMKMTRRDSKFILFGGFKFPFCIQPTTTDQFLFPSSCYILFSSCVR